MQFSAQEFLFYLAYFIILSPLPRIVAGINYALAKTLVNE
jgi:hypothetical protein